MINVIKNISIEKLMYKLSASVVYAILSAVALNFFFQPGHVYSSGITGLAQIFTTLSYKLLGHDIPRLYHLVLAESTFTRFGLVKNR